MISFKNFGGNVGGRGSGYRIRYGVKRKTDQSLPLDIRSLHKKNLLKPGAWVTSSYSRGGNTYASIGAWVYEDHILLKYTYNKTEKIEQRIDFTYTPCHYGGERVWFTCPDCGRRCAVIYNKDKYYSCRLCCNLIYPTQCEVPRDRLFTKANKLRESIGGRPGSLNDLPWIKPKWMHEKTWSRTLLQIRLLEKKGWKASEEMLGLFNI